MIIYLIFFSFSWQIEFTAEQIEGKSDFCMHYVSILNLFNISYLRMLLILFSEILFSQNK